MTEASANQLGMSKRMAVQILEGSLGKTVLIRLRGGKSIRGNLKGFDQHLNLVLERAEDVTDTEKIEDYKNRLKVKKRLIIPIKDGVKFREPLTGSRRDKVEARITEFEGLIVEIGKLKVKKLINKGE